MDSRKKLSLLANDSYNSVRERIYFSDRSERLISLFELLKLNENLIIHNDYVSERLRNLSKKEYGLYSTKLSLDNKDAWGIDVGVGGYDYEGYIEIGFCYVEGEIILIVKNFKSCFIGGVRLHYVLKAKINEDIVNIYSDLIESYWETHLEKQYEDYLEEQEKKKKKAWMKKHAEKLLN